MRVEAAGNMNRESGTAIVKNDHKTLILERHSPHPFWQLQQSDLRLCQDT
jgi:hypothetical protein